MPATSTLEEIVEVVEGLTADSSIHGILVQSPEPEGVDAAAAAQPAALSVPDSVGERVQLAREAWHYGLDELAQACSGGGDWAPYSDLRSGEGHQMLSRGEYPDSTQSIVAQSI